MIPSRKIFAVCASGFTMVGCGGGAEVAPAADARVADDGSSIESVVTVSVRDAWARPADSGATSAAYLVLANRGTTADTVVGVVAEAAESAMVHQTMQHEGTMHMSALPALPVPAGDEVSLAPLGTHVMLLRLRRPLRVGDTVAFGLLLASGDTLAVSAVTRAP
ncbi:MAG: copper chaperone PCu(A)C [Gemmatimonadetes bacterium]|nr:copper chaperone PCu(A)C [Gemmatimonadota bacterium]